MKTSSFYIILTLKKFWNIKLKIFCLGIIISSGIIFLGILFHILSFGTPYNEINEPIQSDATIVFGAAVFSNGQPSDALYDRTNTACLLYQEKQTKLLVFSGGKSQYAPCSEPQAMKKIALQKNIPDLAIILDEQGTNTKETVRQAKMLAEKYGWKKIQMVSHDYHLARIQLFCDRAGLDIIPISCQESYFLTKKPYFIMREVFAWLYYWILG